jgi:hypothetical protein
VTSLTSMTDNRRENRLFLRVAAVMLVCVLLLSAVYLLFGTQIIRDLYTGKLESFLGMRVHPDQRPLEEYLHDINQRFVTYLVLAPLLTLLCFFLLYKAFKFLFSKIEANPPTKTVGVMEFQRDWLIALGIYVLITIIYFYPCLATINSALIGPAEDNMQTYWGLSYGYDCLVKGTGSLTYVNDVFYPEGSSFYYHSWSFYNQAASLVLRQFFNQTTCYNLLILLTFVLAGIGAFLLIKYLLKNSYLAILGGFLFAFNPSHFAHAQHHLNIASIQFVPFFALFFIRAVRNEGKTYLILAAFFFFLNSLADWNYMIIMFWFMVFGYCYLAFQRRNVWLPDISLKIAFILGATFVVLSPWLMAMILIGIKQQEVTTFGHSAFVGDLLGLIVPPKTHLVGFTDLIQAVNLSYTGNAWEAAVYLGLAALILVIIAWRKVLAQTAKYLIGMFAFLLMTLGPQPHVLGRWLPVAMPDRIVMFMPFLGNARCPSRFVVVVYLFWSVVVAISLSAIIDRMKSRKYKIALMAVVPFVLFLDFFATSDRTTTVSLPKCYSIMERAGERYGVLDLPSGYAEVDRYMMYQALHHLPIVQGWASRKLSETLIDSLDFVDFKRQKQQLIESKVKYIVIHKQFLPRKSVNPEDYVEHYPTVYQDERSIVFKLY